MLEDGVERSLHVDRESVLRPRNKSLDLQPDRTEMYTQTVREKLAREYNEDNARERSQSIPCSFQFEFGQQRRTKISAAAKEAVMEKLLPSGAQKPPAEQQQNKDNALPQKSMEVIENEDFVPTLQKIDLDKLQKVTGHFADVRLDHPTPPYEVEHNYLYESKGHDGPFSQVRFTKDMFVRLRCHRSTQKFAKKSTDILQKTLLNRTYYTQQIGTFKRVNIKHTRSPPIQACTRILSSKCARRQQIC